MFRKKIWPWLRSFLCRSGSSSAGVGATPIPQPLTGQVLYGRSRELVCLHEAGHAAAAIYEGARVVEMEFYPQKMYGRTRVDRSGSQRPTILLGGLAVEYWLWTQKRLLLSSGACPTEKEFIDKSSDNALVDKIGYFNGDHRDTQGYWPAHLDKLFLHRAIELSVHLDTSLVERIAGVLLAEIRLDGKRIEEIVNS